MSQVIQVSERSWPRIRPFGWDPYLVPVMVGGLLVSDFLVSIASFILASYLRLGPPLFIWGGDHLLPTGVVTEFRPIWSVLVFVPFVRMAVMWYCQLYRVQGEFSLNQDLSRILKATLMGSIAIILGTFFYRGGFEFRGYSYSRMLFLLDGLFALYGFLFVRVSLRMAQTIARRRGHNIIPAVVIGDGDLAELCVQQISGNPRLGYQLVGVLTASNEGKRAKKSGLPIIGTIRDLPALVHQWSIQEVLITDDQLSPQTLFEAIMKCGRTHHPHYHVIPNLLNCLPQKTEIDQIGVLPMVRLFEEPLHGVSRYLKRGLDLLGASLVFLFTSPLWLIFALLIKRESPGPVFYKQERVGMDGQVFLLYKFRSMRSDADDQTHQQVMKQLIGGHDINNGTRDNPVYGKVKDDDRITRIGRWMRRFSLDELPQLINVLRGEMSLVGPRPPIPYEVECYQQWHRARFHAKPGLTGLWQVSGRNRLRFDEMVRLDLFYIENWSLWLDLKIMLKTPVVMLSGCTES